MRIVKKPRFSILLFSLGGVLLPAALPSSLNTAQAEPSHALPSKSEWLPGTIRRGADGKLHLVPPEEVASKQAETAPPQTNQKPLDLSCTGEAKILHKDSTTLSWKAPSTNVDGSTLKNLGGFMVHYWTTNSHKDKKSVDVKKATSHAITDLESGKTYCLAVTAYTEDGLTSDYSKIVAIRIEQP